MKIEKLKGVYIKVAEKNLKARIVHKHDLEANWLLATGFTPKQGEIIVYDIDEAHPYERIKIGDGVQNVNSLPFADDALRVELESEISEVSALVGDTSVSEQINTALSESAVLYSDAQALTDEQKQQAQDNIGFSENDALELVMGLNLVSPVAAEDGSIYTDENGVLYSL